MLPPYLNNKVEKMYCGPEYTNDIKKIINVHIKITFILFLVLIDFFFNVGIF